jgi:hypothetical protein
MKQMVNDKDHIQHLIAHTKREKDKLERRASELLRIARERARMLEEEIRALDRIMERYDKPVDELLLGIGADSDEAATDAAATDTRLPIGEAIDRFLSETGNQEFTAPQVVAYMKAAGYPVKPASTLNSVRESLRRRITRGEIEKPSEGKYRVRPATVIE